MKKFDKTYIYILVMGSSWKFPARASPSYEDSEPSRAELGHFNFRAENELDFFFDIQLFLLQFLFAPQKLVI